MDLVESKTLKYDLKTRHPWEVARLHFIRNLLSSVIRENKISKPVIFDIGCGDAYVAVSIATSFPGAEVHAVDTALDKKKVLEILELTGRNDMPVFFYKNLEDIALPEGKKAEVILMLDVIEHTGDDEGFLKDLMTNRFVSDDSCFIITAPAWPALFSSHDTLLHHFRRYTKSALIQTLQRSGFKSVESGYFFLTLLFPRFFRLSLEKLNLVQPAVKGIGQWKGGSLLSGVLVLMLRIDIFICRLFSCFGLTVPGLSVYSVCRPAVS